MIINNDNFENEVTKYEGKVLIDFYADWCGPCKIMSPVIEQIEEEKKDVVKVGKVNVDDNPELAEKFGIMSIPTIIIFENGEPVKSFVGVTSKEEIEAQIK